MTNRALAGIAPPTRHQKQITSVEAGNPATLFHEIQMADRLHLPFHGTAPSIMHSRPKHLIPPNIARNEPG